MNISGLVGYLGILGLLSMKAALEVATIIATITKNAAITECFPPLSPTISPRVTPSETSLRATFVFVFCQASCFSEKESRRCCCPSDGGHLCLQALARPKTSSQRPRINVLGLRHQISTRNPNAKQDQTSDPRPQTTYPVLAHSDST